MSDIWQIYISNQIPIIVYFPSANFHNLIIKLYHIAIKHQVDPSIIHLVPKHHSKPYFSLRDIEQFPVSFLDEIKLTKEPYIIYGEVLEGLDFNKESEHDDEEFYDVNFTFSTAEDWLIKFLLRHTVSLKHIFLVKSHGVKMLLKLLNEIYELTGNLESLGIAKDKKRGLNRLYVDIDIAGVDVSNIRPFLLKVSNGMGRISNKRLTFTFDIPFTGVGG